MALPPSIQTVQVNFGPFLDFEGAALPGSTTFTPSTPIRHEATGTPILNKPITVQWDPSGMGAVILPATDSVGLNVTGFTYWVTHQVTDRSAPNPAGGTIALPAAAPVVDLDLLVPTTASNGVVVEQPEVLSVAGLTGAISAADLSAAGVGGGLDDTGIAGLVATPGTATGDALRAAYVSHVAAPTGVAATDTAMLTTAANAVRAAGGGEVRLLAGTYKLNAPLPVLPGVTYRGVPPVQTQAVTAPGSYLADSPPTFTGGTVLQGDGTFACFQANATDLATPAADFGATQIANFGLYGLGLDGFTYGLRVGARNIMGLVWSTIDQLYIKNCSQWGVYLANFIHLNVGFIETTLCQNGQYYGCRLDASTYQGGNSVFGALYHLIAQDGRDRRLCRGIVFEAQGGTGSNGGVLNEIEVHRLEVNNYSVPLLTATATFTSGSTSVSVPDGTKFAAGQVVTFTGSNFGYTAGYGYVVASVSGNTITLAAKRTGAAISASGSGTLTLQTYGFPALEVTAADANSHVASSRFPHLDIEGETSASVYVDNAQQAEFGFTMNPNVGHRLLDYVGRSASYCHFRSSGPVITDFDAGSANSTFTGSREKSYQRLLRGQSFDATNQVNGLQVSGGQQDVTNLDLQARSGGMIYPAAGMGERIFPRNANITLSGANTGNVVYSGASNLTYTLPTIVIDTTNAGGSNIGAVFDIYNIGGGTLTINTQNSQLINGKAAKTTYSLLPNNRVKLVAAKDDSDNLIWLGWTTALLT